MVTEHPWSQLTWALGPQHHPGLEPDLCKATSAGEGKEGKGRGRKTALFGQAARESCVEIRYGRVTFPLSGGTGSHGTCLPKKEKSQLPKIMGFQLSVILTLLCLLMALQTNKTHPAWQA